MKDSVCSADCVYVILNQSYTYRKVALKWKEREIRCLLVPFPLNRMKKSRSCGPVLQGDETFKI